MFLLALIYAIAYVYALYIQKGGLLYSFFKDSKVCLGMFILSLAVIIF